MIPDPPKIDLDWLRRQILGSGFRFTTPFGERLLTYADFTASGRSMRFLQHYLMKLEESYANTHTEDDETGRSTTLMLHHAENVIKRAVNGDENTCLVAAGTGATGAIKRLQEILGVYIPPATRAHIESVADENLRGLGENARREFIQGFEERRPVVFVGPYEHHSNEVSWRESLAEVLEIEMGEDGGIDLAVLESQVSRPEFEGRLKIGSFSAASNVTGIVTPVYDIARILHRHGALACFDFAASAPYVEIDMNRDEESYFDAVFFSPHKFLGGPGSTGILLFHRRIYRGDLPPTFPSGGTVDYVGFTDQEYTPDIETREKPGTPGTLQLVKCMLAIELKKAVGQDVIEERERRYTREVLQRFGANPNIEILGNPDPERRLGIVSFNIRDGNRYLHPKLVTRLLNDLFGIQSRAGCACAGPYGHRLLGIGEELSNRHRDVIRSGCQGLKPGWARLCFHYTMDAATVDFICAAVEFLAQTGPLFLNLYRFDLDTGSWAHLDEREPEVADVSLIHALGDDVGLSHPVDDEELASEYQYYLDEARSLSERLREQTPVEPGILEGFSEDLVYFRVVHDEADTASDSD